MQYSRLLKYSDIMWNPGNLAIKDGVNSVDWRYIVRYALKKKVSLDIKY